MPCMCHALDSFAPAHTQNDVARANRKQPRARERTQGFTQCLGDHSRRGGERHRRGTLGIRNRASVDETLNMNNGT